MLFYAWARSRHILLSSAMRKLCDRDLLVISLGPSLHFQPITNFTTLVRTPQYRQIVTRRLLLDLSNIQVRFFFAKIKDLRSLQTSPDCGTANLLGLRKVNVYSFFVIEKFQR
jgi:hypothetical protein